LKTGVSKKPLSHSSVVNSHLNAFVFTAKQRVRLFSADRLALALMFGLVHAGRLRDGSFSLSICIPGNGPNTSAFDSAPLCGGRSINLSEELTCSARAGWIAPLPLSNI
jgi:hypothetical protein